ncbi:MAG: hypothetical protein AAF610_14750, partial [Pseudomonadota bacterium]
FQRAAKIEPDSVGYRAAVGQSLINLDKDAAGIRILEECLAAEPDNTPIRNLLARGYVGVVYSGWVQDDDGLFYATKRAHVDQGLETIQKAEALNVEDVDTRRLITEKREFLQSNLKRRFRGSIFAGIAGGLLYTAVNTLLFFMGPLYFVACMTPQYALNARIYEGEKTFDETMSGSGLIGALMGAVLLPVMIVFNGLRNFTGDNRTRTQ